MQCRKHWAFEVIRPWRISDGQSQTLAVVFRNGTEYHYYSVPEDVFEGFKVASSPGQYLDLYVKKAGYQYACVR